MSTEPERTLIARFRSSSSEAIYGVLLDEDTDACTCSCPGFTHRGSCSHVERVGTWLRLGMRPPARVLDPPVGRWVWSPVAADEEVS